MTRDEKTTLDLLTEFVQEWRKEDAAWKLDTGTRLRSVEDYITADRAVAADRERVGLSRRARIGVAVSALLGVLGFLGSVVKVP